MMSTRPARLLQPLRPSSQVASVESETVDTKKADLKPGPPSGSDSFRDMSSLLRLLSSSFTLSLRVSHATSCRLAKGSVLEMTDGMFASPGKRVGGTSGVAGGVAGLP